MPDRQCPNPLLTPAFGGPPRAPSEGEVYADAYLARAKNGATASHAVQLIAGQSVSPASEGLLWQEVFLNIKHPL